jgi:GAF domain-containing protein
MVQNISSQPTTSARSDLLEWLLQVHDADPVQRRRGRVMAISIGFLAISAILISLVAASLYSLPLNTLLPALPASDLLAVIAVLAILYSLNREGMVTLAGVLFSLLLLIIDSAIVSQLGTLSASALVFLVPVMIVGFFGIPVASIFMAILSCAIYLWLNIGSNPNYVREVLNGEPAIQSLLVYVNIISASVIAWLFSRTAKQALEESRELSLALVVQRQELEERLEQQTRQLQATTTVAHAVAGARNVDQLLEDIVRLVRETFGYYHVQVFLVDEEQEYAILRQSTGEIGQQLLERGHRLPVGSLSVIGQVTGSSQAVVARDADSDFVHRRNELLPLTRSEFAVPLIVGDKVIGALDMQSVEPDDFPDTAISTFQAMADQLAIAIENARLFEAAQRSLHEIQELSRETVQRSWSEFLEESRREELEASIGPSNKGVQLQRSRVIERVLGAGSVIVSTGKDGRQSFLAAPIVVRNEVIGVLGVEPDSERDWTQDDLTLMQSIAERTALAAENARLYLQAQRAAERERLIGNIASRLQRAPSLALLLESAAKELAEALGTENVYAEISLGQPFATTRQQVQPDQEHPSAAQLAAESTRPARKKSRKAEAKQ